LNYVRDYGDIEVIDIVKQMLYVTDTNEGIERFHNMEKQEKLALLKNMKQVKDERLGMFLNSIYETESDKEVKKEIRRLLFILKTSGVKIEEPKVNEQSVLRMVEEKKIHRAFISTYDNELIRIVECAFQIKRDKYIYVSAFTHFCDGLKESFMGELDSSGVEDIIKDSFKRKPEQLELVEISPAYGMYILEESSAISDRKTNDVSMLKRKLGIIPSDVKRPGDIYNLTTPEVIYTPFLKEIFRHNIFLPFHLKWGQIEEDIKEYRAVGTSSLLIPPYLVEEKREAIIKRVRDPEEMKSKTHYLKRLLEDYAYMFYLKKEYPFYKALIEHLSKEDDMDSIIDHFIRKSLSDKEDKTRDLIVNPYG